MIWQAWAVLVLVGAGAAYLAFVEKRAAVFTSLATVGIFAVLALGSLSIETKWTTSSEPGITVLFVLTASLGAIVFPVALTKSGPYAEDDDADGEEVATDPAAGTDPDSSWLDGIARRLT
jgi:hypothetical protein